MIITFQGDKKQLIKSRTQRVLERIPHKSVNADIPIQREDFDEIKNNYKKITANGYFNYWQISLGKFFNSFKSKKR